MSAHTIQAPTTETHFRYFPDRSSPRTGRVVRLVSDAGPMPIPCTVEDVETGEQWTCKPTDLVTPRTVEGPNPYEQKQEERRARLEGAADRANTEASRRFQAARAAVAGIEFGQPILVGHHSEGRHRAALKRQDTHLRKGVEAHKQAADLAYRAAAVGSGGVSSDDPEAVAKLIEKRDSLTAKQEQDKRINALYRKRDAAGLAALGLDLAALDEKMKGAYSWEKAPVPTYALSNRNKEIRRLAERIADLQKMSATPSRTADAGADPVTVGAVTVTDDTEDNRVRVSFPRDMEGLRSALKSRGWKWSPTRGAWVRMRSRGVYELALQIVRSSLANRLEEVEGEVDDEA